MAVEYFISINNTKMTSDNKKGDLSIGEQLGQLRGDSAQRDTILVVDDDMPLRATIGKMLKRALDGSGIKVVTANEGPDAIDQLQKGLHENVILVISDLDMPHMQGDELLKALRMKAMPYHLPADKVPSVLMSANLRLVQNPNAIADASIEKPFNPTQLKDAISMAIARVLKRRKKGENFGEGDPA